MVLAAPVSTGLLISSIVLNHAVVPAAEKATIQ